MGLVLTHFFKQISLTDIVLSYSEQTATRPSAVQGDVKKVSMEYYHLTWQRVCFGRGLQGKNNCMDTPDVITLTQGPCIVSSQQVPISE